MNTGTKETDNRKIQKLKKCFALPAAFLAIVTGLLWVPLEANPFLDTQYTFYDEQAATFSRQIGQALVHGIDIEKRVSNMTVYGFGIFPLLFLAFWCVLSFLFRKEELSEEENSFLTELTIAAFPALIVTLFSRMESSFFSNFSPVAYAAVICTLLYLRFGRKALTLPLFKWAFFTSFALEFIGIRGLYALHLLKGTIKIQSSLLCGVAFMLIVFVLCIIAVLFSRSSYCESLCAATTGVYAAPIAVSIFLEACNVLNHYAIFVPQKTLLSLAIIALGCVLGVLWYVLKGKKGNPSGDYRKWQFFLLILGIAMLATQPPSQIIGGWELYESSNSGSDIFSLLVYGEIPFVENLNVHMLLEEVGALIYGVLNQDPIGAIWFFYPIIDICIYLLFYFFFVQLTDRETGVLCTLLFPVGAFQWFMKFYGLFPILTAVYAVKKKKRSAMLAFVLSCVLLCLYRADVGIACSISALVFLTVYLVLQREYRLLAVLWGTGVLAGTLFAALFIVICDIRGITPLARFLEMISIMTGSDINWAYSDVTFDYGFKLFFCYLLIPSMAVVCTAGVFYDRRSKDIPIEYCLLIAMLSLAQFLNYKRGIVRHNVAEVRFYYSIGFAGLAIILSIWMLRGYKKTTLPIFLTSLIFVPLAFGSTNVAGMTLLQNCVNEQMKTDAYQYRTEPLNRVQIHDGLEISYKPLKTIFDATLSPAQTYFDYSFATSLYSLTERNKPVYTNQSPSQLNREFDHLLFIRELKEKSCPYALSQVGGNGWDGIDLDMNHYLVAEYLYRNYRPLCIIDWECLWVMEDEYETRSKQLHELADSGIIDVSFIDDNDPSLIRNYPLGQVAWLWGTYDGVPAKEVLKVPNLVNENESGTVFIYSLEPLLLDQEEGNYIEILADTTSVGTASVELLNGDGEPLCTFTFDTHGGLNRYLIRASATYLWHTGRIQQMRVSFSESTKISGISVLRGDIDYESMNGLQIKVLNSDVRLNAKTGQEVE